MGHDIKFFKRVTEDDVEAAIVEVDTRQYRYNQLPDGKKSGRPHSAAKIFEMHRNMARETLGKWEHMYPFDFSGHNSCGRIYRTIAPAGFSGYGEFTLSRADLGLVAEGISTLADDEYAEHIIRALIATLVILNAGGEVKVVAD